MTFENIKKWRHYIFLILLVGVSLYYNYHEIVFRQPQSIHAWRQSDCASIALNYYQNGMKLFAPETHNLTSDGGSTGKCCTSEIPILYYCVAILYKIFGHHDSLFRILNTIIFFLGLFYLFKLFLYVLNDSFWAITLTLLIFTSPVLVYYGNNFLSNSSSLAFSFIGWYYFTRFVKERTLKWFFISATIFALAGAFKVTAFFSLFAIAGVLVLEALKIIRFGSSSPIFRSPLKLSLSIFLSIFLVGSWVLYAHWFNNYHDCTYFSTTIFPIWDLTQPEIVKVLHNIKVLWLDSYFHPASLLFLILCTLVVMAMVKKGNKLLNWIIFLIFLEVIFYILLQFWTFRDHDYYTIDIFILPVLILLSTFDIIKNNFLKIFNSVVVKILFVFFLLFNIYHAKQKIDERYSVLNNYFQMEDIYKLEPYLRQIGISPNDTIISIPDISHVTLYLMNQKGWTEYTDARFNKGEKIRYNQDSLGIAKSILKGAKYMVVNGMKEIYLKPYLQPFCHNLAGKFNRVLIFDMKNPNQNFSFEQRKTKAIYSCSAENRNHENSSFIGTDGSTLFMNGETQNNQWAKRGNYSSMLTPKSPYGMTLKIQGVKVDESFTITVWRKAETESTSCIVASSTSNDFYNSKYKVTERRDDGWEKLSMELFITEKLPGDELVVYLYNPEQSAVWFDDLEIIHFENDFGTTDFGQRIPLNRPNQSSLENNFKV
jgi:hypothetical protein